MTEIRCTKCNKLLLEAKGEATIKTKCPRCKTDVNRSISYQERLSDIAIKK